MDANPINARAWLESEYRRRQARNPRFSMRMFAQQIGITSGRLSELMNGKRRMTSEIARKISSQLLLTVEERKALLLAIDGRNSLKVADNFEPLSADTFHALADWQHFAILSLMETDDFKPDYEWVAQRLSLTVQQTRESVQRLMRLNFIVEKDGQWLRRDVPLTTTHDIESLALRISHRQSLEQVITALDEVPLQDRDVTSITMAIDKKRIPHAKEMIKKFRRELCKYLESGDTKDEVYNLNLQLVPVTNLKKEKV